MKHEELKRQQLEIVQAVITRMAGNSFQIKGFTMVMAALLGGLYGERQEMVYLILLIPVCIMCALMDAYYLQLERKYRALYDRKVDQLQDELTPKEICNMSVRGIERSYWDCLFSKSLIMPYGIILLLVALVLIRACVAACCPCL